MANPIFYNTHQIQTGLHTTGNELIDINENNYIGGYHRYPNDTFWSEFQPESNSIQLFRISIGIVNQLTKAYKREIIKKIPNYVAPQPYRPLPNDSDYMEGQFERYFVQSLSMVNPIVMEIDHFQYRSINKNNIKGIDGTLWKGGFLQWRLSKVAAVVHNQMEINKLSKKLSHVGMVLKDIMEFVK